MDTLDQLVLLITFISGNSSFPNETPSSISIKIWSLQLKLASNFASITRALCTKLGQVCFLDALH